jgi:hypothetical protein
MGMKKDYNPNEIDAIQQGYDMKDDNEKKEAKYRKQANIKKRSNDKEEVLEVKRDILKKYGSINVKEEHLIKKDMLTIQPRCCMTCYTFKIFPYEFLNAKGNDNDKSNCSKCMTEISKRVMKYKVKCVCGTFYDNNDLGLSKHECSRNHINALKQIKATGLGVVYKRPSLRKICSANAIPNYNALTVDEIFKALKALDKIKIPEGLPEDMPEDVV